MSLRLKSRLHSPPGGFQFTQKETGWTRTAWDFRGICSELQKHRIANPRLKLNTDMGAIMAEVDEANARRVMSIRGADIYVMSTDGSPPKQSAPRPPVVGVGAKEDGNMLLTDLLGGDPVDAALANHRAAVCASCPMNAQGDWKRFFTVPAARTISAMLGAKVGRNLSTELDDKLGICEPCSCPLSMKVHIALPVVLKHTTSEVMDKLPSHCWIKQESNATL